MRVFIFILILISKGLFAQEQQIEFLLRNDVEDQHFLFPVSADKICLINEQQKTFSRKLIINVKLIDSTMQVRWSKDISLENNYELLKYLHKADELYLLCKEDEEKNIQLIKLNLETGEYLSFESKLLTDMEIKFISVENNIFIVAGEYNDKPVSELHSFFDQSVKILPQLYKAHHLITNTLIHHDTIYTFLNNSKKCTQTLVLHDLNGKVHKQVNLQDQKYSFLNSKLLTINNNEALFCGSYATACSEFSKGFYFLPINSLNNAKFYSFYSLNNYFKYLPKRRQERLQSRVEQRTKKGKNADSQIKVSLSLPTGFNNNFILGEVYSVGNKSIDSYRLPFGRPKNTELNEEEGSFKYSHAIICELNNKGEVIYNASVSLEGIESQNLSPKTHFYKQNDSLFLVYPKNDKLIFNSIDAAGNPKILKEVSLKKAFTDKVYDYSLDMFYWSEKSFLAYGYKNYRLGTESPLKQFFYIKRFKTDFK